MESEEAALWPGGHPRRSTLVLGVLVLAAVVSTRWVRLNLSPSVPVGVYRLARLAPPLARGTPGLLPVPVAIRPWHPGGAPPLKPRAAGGGGGGRGRGRARRGARASPR